MLTEKEMEEIAKKYIFELSEETKIDILLLHDVTIKKQYGNIYFYNNKKLIETNDDRYALIGNAPFLVENKTGKIVELGTSMSEEYYIKEYEEGRWPNNRR